MNYSELGFFSNQGKLFNNTIRQNKNMNLLFSDTEASKLIFDQIDNFFGKEVISNFSILKSNSKEEIHDYLDTDNNDNSCLVLITPYKIETDVDISNRYSDSQTNIGYQRHLQVPKSGEEHSHLSLGSVKNNIDDCEVFLRDKKSISINIAACKRSEIPLNPNANICGLFAEQLCQIAKFAGAGLSKKLIVISGFAHNILSNHEIELILTILWYIMEGMGDQYYEDPEKDEMQQIIVTINGNMDLTFYKSLKTNRYWVKMNEASKPIPCTEQEFFKARQNDISLRLINL